MLQCQFAFAATVKSSSHHYHLISLSDHAVTMRLVTDMSHGQPLLNIDFKIEKDICKDGCFVLHVFMADFLPQPDPCRLHLQF